jgi:glucosamine-6-phosphate deaminase
MEVAVRTDPAAVASEARDAIGAALTAGRLRTLGLATGRTPERLYRLLCESRLDFSSTSFFNLDEFAGLGPDHAASFHRRLWTRLLSGIHAVPERVRLLRGDAPDPKQECDAYEAAIRGRGGIDLQLLGLGRNGHIAFNEPGSPFDSRTRVIPLEEGTVRDYAPAFAPGQEVPRTALTMGVATILEAHHLLVLATGVEKAAVVRRVIEGPVTPDVPGSALQLHARATFILDEAAASELGRG